MTRATHWLVLAPVAQRPQSYLWMRLNAQGEPDGARGEVTAAQLATLATRYPADACCLLVSVSALAIHRVHLPGRHDATGMRALPWLLEEKLGAPMQQMAVVPLASDGEHIWAAALEQALLDQWQAPFQETGLALARIIPDALMLPLHDGAPSALRWQGGWLLRTHGWQGVQVDDDWLALWLAARQREWPDEKPAHCYDEPPEATGWQKKPLQDAFTLLARAVPGCDISLLPERASRRHVALRPVLYAAAAVVVLLFAWKGLTLWQLSQQGDALEQQVRKQFRARFPGEAQNNLQATVRRSLAQEGDGELAAWMAAIPALPQGVTVRELDWQAEASRLRLVPDGEASGLALAQQRLEKAFTLARQRDGAWILTLKDDER